MMQIAGDATAKNTVTSVLCVWLSW